MRRIVYIVCVGAMVFSVGAASYIAFRFPDKYSQIIADECNKYGLDTSLVKGVIWTESKFRADAVSPSGALGLMQLLPSTAKWCAEKLNLDSPDCFDAATNIKMGTFYLSYLLRKFECADAIAAYNAGEGNVLKWLAEGVEPQFKETKDYVRKVFRAKQVYEFKQR